MFNCIIVNVINTHMNAEAILNYIVVVFENSQNISHYHDYDFCFQIYHWNDNFANEMKLKFVGTIYEIGRSVSLTGVRNRYVTHRAPKLEVWTKKIVFHNIQQYVNSLGHGVLLTIAINQ